MAKTADTPYGNQVVVPIVESERDASLLHVTFPFAYNAPGLSDGIEVVGWSPQVGDIVRDAWINIPEAWDGTSPYGDIIIDGTAGAPWFQHFSTYYDMTLADADATNGVSVPLNNSNSLFDLLWSIGGVVVNTATPLILFVSQDGSRGGADPAASQGQATLHLLILPGA